MSQGILTNAGRDLFAAKQGAMETLIIDRFMLANIPGLNPADPVDPDEPIPNLADQVATLAVTQTAYVSADKVVYSLFMGTQVGDFDFNWVGLLADDDTLVAVRYIETVSKFATTGQDIGNAITRNFLITYTDAQAITNVTVDADTWQLQFDYATETQAGIVEAATQSETDNGEPEKFPDAAKIKNARDAAITELGITGAIAAFPSDTAPIGWIKLNGAVLSRSSYSKLYDFAVNSNNLAASEATKQLGQFGPGDGITTFTIPDFRGEFIRGWDDGKGIDDGRTLGSWQVATALPGDGDGWHSLVPNLNDDSHRQVLGFERDTPPHEPTPISTRAGEPIIDALFDVDGLQQYGQAEISTDFARSRPRNIALLYCIKY